MSNTKRNIAVLLTDLGAVELASPFRLWLRQGEVFGPYIYCKSVDPNGPYFHMVVQDADTIDFEIQVQHAYVKAVVCASDFRKLGFTTDA